MQGRIHVVPKGGGEVGGWVGMALILFIENTSNVWYGGIPKENFEN